MAYSEENIVSEKFWLSLAGENIQNSFDKRTSAAAKLRLTIEWAFTLFTTSGFLIGVFKDVTSFPTIVMWFFGVAFSLLVIAYVFAGISQYPVKQSYHPNDTEQIASVFSAAVKKQSDYFQAASVITILAFLSISFGVLLLFTGKSKQPVIINHELYPLHFSSIIEKDEDSTYNIALTAMTNPNQKGKVNVEGSIGKDSTFINQELADIPFITDTTGKVWTAIKVPQGFDSYWIHVSISVKTGDTVTKKIKSIRIPKP